MDENNNEEVNVTETDNDATYEGPDNQAEEVVEEVEEKTLNNKYYNKNTADNKPAPYATFDKKTIIIIVIILVILYGLYIYFTYFQ